MKTAFSYLDQRIAPVFDAADQILVVETVGRAVRAEVPELLYGELPLQKVQRLAELGVDALVCGAVSRPLHGLLISYGIRVMAFVTGEVRTVIDAWLQGCLDWRSFAMPGCGGGNRRRFRQMYGSDCTQIPAPGRIGRGAGRGSGRVRGGPENGGRRGGGRCGSVEERWVCPRCGHWQTYSNGTACREPLCPQCGHTMTRRQCRK